jgi:hypothetical protein
VQSEEFHDAKFPCQLWQAVPSRGAYGIVSQTFP